MGIPVSLILIAVGLVLALAVHATSSAVDITTIGWIIFAVGAFGILLSLVFWDSWAGGGWFRRGGGYPGSDPHYDRGYGTRRRTVVHEDDPPPY